MTTSPMLVLRGWLQRSKSVSKPDSMVAAATLCRYEYICMRVQVKHSQSKLVDLGLVKRMMPHARNKKRYRCDN